MAEQLDANGKPITPAPAAGANKPADEQGGKTVPLPELMKEREKRQGLEAERDSLRQTLAVLQQQAQARNQYQQPPVVQQQPQQNTDHVALQELWQSNPQKAVQTEIMMAINWFDRAGAQVDQQEAEIAVRYPDYNNFRTPIRNYLRTIPLQQRTQPGVVEAAYYFVKGQQVDNIIKTSNEELIRKMRAGEAIQGFDGAGQGAPIPQAKVLTEEQRRVASAMGITPEQYQANMKV
jgi:hypothetical protein